MNLKKLEERLVSFLSFRPSSEGYKEELDQFAQDFARIFASQRPELVDEFRSMLEKRIPAQWTYIRNSSRDDGNIRGYFIAVLGMTTAYPAAVVLEAENKEMAEQLRGFGLEPLMVALLEEEKATAKSLSVYLVKEHTSVVAVKDDEPKALELYSPERVEQNLGLLFGLELVESFGDPPEHYRLTPHGEDVADMLKSEDNQSDPASQKEEGNVEK